VPDDDDAETGGFHNDSIAPAALRKAATGKTAYRPRFRAQNMCNA
jgi:hypothetical protein